MHYWKRKEVPSDIPDSDDERVHPRYDGIAPFPVVVSSDGLGTADTQHRLVQRLEERHRQHDTSVAVRRRDRLQTFVLVVNRFRHRSSRDHQEHREPGTAGGPLYGTNFQTPVAPLSAT